jgi:phosphoserine phosphatase
MRNWKLACFDLDGTLVVGTSTCQHMRERLGFGAVTEDLDKQYAAGLIDSRYIANVEAPYYRGLSDRDIQALLTDLPLIDGIAETLEYLRSRGITLLLTTITWSFASCVFADRFGFHGYSGYGMERLPIGTLSGRVILHFDEFSKREYVKQYCDERGIDMKQVFAVGDSRSDVPLFETVGFSVALNADSQAISAASTAIKTNTLTDVLALIPGLQAQRSATRSGIGV